MKVTVVVTVLNEAGSVRRLMGALAGQTRQPDEVIVVDGGSNDGTTKEILSSKSKIRNLRIFVRKGANIAEGRNCAIKKAKAEVIVVTDAGCVPEREWLALLVEPIEAGEAEVAAGFYRMKMRSGFQKVLGGYLGVLPENLERENFMPSSRSVAFTKEIWKKVGGYPEELGRTGEDTLFDLRLLEAGARFKTVPAAVVEWELPGTLGGAARKFFSYAKGDGEAGIWWHPKQGWRTHLVKIGLVYLRYLGFLAFWLWQWQWGVMVIIGYLIWAAVKNRRVGLAAVVWGPVVQIVSDFSVMGGVLAGLAARKRNR